MSHLFPSFVSVFHYASSQLCISSFVFTSSCAYNCAISVLYLGQSRFAHQHGQLYYTFLNHWSSLTCLPDLACEHAWLPVRFKSMSCLLTWLWFVYVSSFKFYTRSITRSQFWVIMATSTQHNYSTHLVFSHSYHRIIWFHRSFSLLSLQKSFLNRQLM